MPIHDYIVLDYSKNPYLLVCKNCGKTQKMPKGEMPLDIFLAINDAFIKIHKKCKGD